ncbi:hypothetical protein B0J11DRAFT_577824 [Dendryphion nanum]|uniref:Uncharacterized protein n=1 Tax=Dendryphion nanum TaxID=256645 RepID=A0A9P9IRZ3_9PLEO|nr:hypothetical protein B0J11DRAFT_577824 [Dendryphion nanum]
MTDSSGSPSRISESTKSKSADSLGHPSPRPSKVQISIPHKNLYSYYVGSQDREDFLLQIEEHVGQLAQGYAKHRQEEAREYQDRRQDSFLTIMLLKVHNCPSIILTPADGCPPAIDIDSWLALELHSHSKDIAALVSITHGLKRKTIKQCPKRKIQPPIEIPEKRATLKLLNVTAVEQDQMQYGELPRRESRNEATRKEPRQMNNSQLSP